MSQTFTLLGHSNVLKSDYYPPIQLNPEKSYGLGLISFHSFNTIPNVDDSNNQFHYDTDKVIVLPKGAYEITDIERYIQRQLIGTFAKEEEKKKLFSLEPNNNTIKCEVRSDTFTIRFDKENSIGKLLGFSKRILESKVLHQSDLPVQILKVSSIRVECNIISGSFYNSIPSHTLYEFPLDVDPGYAINKDPQNVIYLPLNVTTIHNITLTLIDQDGRPIDFQGELVIIRLQLKEL